MKCKTSYPYLQSMISHSGPYFDSQFVDINSSGVSPGTTLFESRGKKKKKRQLRKYCGTFIPVHLTQSILMNVASQ